MKVVLFCGGMGTRLRDYSRHPQADGHHRLPADPLACNEVPAALILGFILCLGYKADVIKNYFLNYNECISNDFIYQNSGQKLHLIEQRYPGLDHHHGGYRSYRISASA